jgi:hypothetical protein
MVRVQDLAIFSLKSLSTHLGPVGSHAIDGRDQWGDTKSLRNGVHKGAEHFMGIAVTFCGVQGQGSLEEVNQGLTGFVAESLFAFEGPGKRPFWQDAGEVFIENKAHGEAIAAVGGATVGLLRCHVPWCAKVIDCGHAPLNLQANAKIAQGRLALWKQKDVHRAYIAMHDFMCMGVGQTIQDLDHEGKQPAWGHGAGPVVECAHGDFCGQNEVFVNDICVFDSQDIGMTQLTDQADLTEELHVVPFSVDPYQGNLQSDFNALDGVSGFPYFTATASAQVFDELVFAQSLA